MKKLLLLLPLILAGCGVSSDVLNRVARQEGITQIEDKGYAIFGCGEDDTFGTEFAGIKNGQHVEGYICGGFTKGYTVRYR